MSDDSINYEKGETPMTDFQFKAYMELRDKCDLQEREIGALQHEIEQLKDKLAIRERDGD